MRTIMAIHWGLPAHDGDPQFFGSMVLNSVRCTQFSTGVLGAKIHRTLRKHTSEKYMSVCLTSESVQQKKRWTAQKNIKTST